MEIIYVDDDSEDIELFLEALQNVDRSIRFSYALSANDALKKLNNFLFTPDAIFVDYHLGGMDGYQFIRQIKEREELQNIPVIVLSGNLSTNLVDEFNKLGVYYFLSKKAVLTDMESALRVILDGIRDKRSQENIGFL
jgi:CheY-like chemotaxis protein